MDLGSLIAAADDGVPMEVRHPVTGVVLQGVTLMLVGTDSERFRRLQRTLTNRKLQQGRKVRVTAEELESEGIDILAECTLGWTGVELDGQELSFSKANARMLYDRLPWLREQADTFIADRANFSKASATN